MKTNQSISLFLAIIGWCIVSTYAQTYNPQNGHYYMWQAIGAPTDMNKTINYINNNIAQFKGLKPYLAVINTPEEMEFISTTMRTKTQSPTQKLIVSGWRLSGETFVYNSGVEVGDKIYSGALGRCYTVCQWSQGYPSTSADKTLLALNNVNNRYEFSNEAFGQNNLYLLEYGGLTEPYFPPPTTMGGNVNIKNMITSEAGVKWNMTSNALLVTVSSASDTYNATITATLTSSITVVIKQGIEAFNVTIRDLTGTRTFTGTFHYQVPFIQTVYSYSQIAGSIITLYGSNFDNPDTGVSAISVATGTQRTPCTSATVLIPYTAITCVLGATSDGNTVTMFPLTVYSGGSNFVYNTSRIPFYDPSTLRVIRIADVKLPDEFPIVQSMISSSKATTVDGNVAYHGVVTSATQAKQISNIFNFVVGGVSTTVFQGLTLSGSNMVINNLGGPNNGVPVFTIANGACNSNYVYCGAGGVRINYSTAYVLFFQNTTANLPDIRSVSWDKAGEMVFYGLDPVQLAPVSYLLDTTGGAIKLINGGSNGFALSNRTITFQGTVYGSVYQENTTSLNIQIPAGTGLNNPLTVTIENQFTLKNAIINFKPPTISSITPKLTSFGGNVIITGTQFGPTATNVSATIKIGVNTYPCANMQIYTPHQQLMCTLPSGSGSNLVFTLNVNGQTTTYQYSYSEPVISSITQNGELINIVGTGFGFDNNQLTTIQNTTILTITVSGDPQTIVAQCPSNMMNGGFTIVSSGLPSTPYDLYLKPIIKAISPAPSTTTVTQINISGSFLNTLRVNGTNAILNVTYDGISISCTSGIVAGTSLSCQLPPITGYHTLVVNSDNVASDPFTFSAATPTIQSVSQDKSSITVVGTNYGNDKSKVSLNYGGNTISADSVTGGNTIIATLPDYQTNGFISVIIDNVESTRQIFKLSPVITSVSSTNTTGGPIIITGLFFNQVNSSGIALPYSVSVSGTPCTNLVFSVSNTEIQCVAPRGVGTGNQIQVTIDSMPGVSLFNYYPPYIASISQNLAIPQITITGFNFGPNSFNLTFCSAWSLGSTVNDNQIIYNVPTTSKNDYLTIAVSGQQSNSYYLPLTPIVSNIGNPPTQGGSVTILGTFITDKSFAGVPLDIAVNFENGQCLNPSYDQSNNDLVCSAPSGTGINKKAIVTIDSMPSAPFTFSYMAPQLTGFSQVGMIGTIAGEQFGSNSSLITASFVSLTNTATRVLPIVGNTESIEVDILPFALSGQLTLHVDGQDSNSISYLLAPVLYSVTSAPLSGGVITVAGHFLNTVSSNGTETFLSITLQSNIPCTNVAKLADDDFSYLTCLLPPGNSENVSLTVTIDGISASIPFSYGAPVISSISVDANNQINITGTNMFADGYNTVVNFGSETYTTFTNTSNSIIFTAPAGQVNDIVSITLNGRTSNGIMTRLYPIITSVTGSATVGSNVTVTGTFLNSYRGDLTTTTFSATVDGMNCLVYPDDSKTSKIIQVPAGTGADLPFTIIIDGRSATTEFSFDAPTTNGTITQDGSLITVYGGNFGTDLSVVNPPNGMTAISVVQDTLVFQLPDTYQSGTISFEIDGQQAIFYLYVTPIITEFSTQVATGGDIVIKGKYFNTKRSDRSDTTITVYVGSESCTFKSAAATSDSLTCTLGAKSIYQGLVTISIDSKVGMLMNIRYNSLPPVVNSASSSHFQTQETVTIYGSYFVEPVTATIGGQACSGASLINSNQLTCTFNGSNSDSQGALNVTVTNDQITGFNSYGFLYNQLDCNGLCANNGQCTNGYCICASGYAGQLCNIAVNTTVTPTVNPSDINYPLFNNVTFNSGIDSLVEVDSNQNVIKQIDLSGAVWSQISANNYSSTVNNVVVSIVTSQYTQQTTVYFAGDNIPVSPSTVKHTVSISGWQFANTINSLQIVYQANAPALFDYNCAPASPTITANLKAGQSPSFTIDTPLGILYTQFSGRVIVDSKIARITSASFTTTAENNSVKFAIQVPNFASQLVYDPTFISYIKPNVIIGCNPSSTTSSNPITTGSTDGTTGTISISTKLTPITTFSMVALLFLITFLLI
ncbi:hypothetical protein PPL_08582 [Heterostelium album PN500]|uniref:EGF-like domain-containing protein n=1 Tax=Heterostelium pallidum (strain ATCC 26659 / Pp 5 / PN500) TaxID=670386 RepID=D3BJ57_HETP5|nr:hypothetical protein PPL_08582 [Heterostelium album PN500]EFA77937.1 hypothetical protein PPL_08582 [Heterostelium album PN500]|eukprot:XP_020430065.1 hypothetical protein PPL_08582 [Heterostelium album PN500]